MSLCERCAFDELFCHGDDFCQSFLPEHDAQLLTSGIRQRQRTRSLSISEIMTILILFHQSHYRDFKAFYTQEVCNHLRREFPGLVSYIRFVELMPSALLPLCAYLRHYKGHCTGISFLDSTDLTVCHNERISQHKVLAGSAARGKTSTGGIQLRTKLKKKMKNQLMPLADKMLLRKRAIAETIIDQLKNISQIEHSRYRSPVNFVSNVVCGLIAYCHQPKKPSLHLGYTSHNQMSR